MVRYVYLSQLRLNYYVRKVLNVGAGRNVGILEEIERIFDIQKPEQWYNIEVTRLNNKS
jgi:hypothetical protein